MHISLVEHIFTLRKSFFDSIQGKTEYCNLIISKLLLIVYKVKITVLFSMRYEKCFVWQYVSSGASLFRINRLFLSNNCLYVGDRQTEVLWGFIE